MASVLLRFVGFLRAGYPAGMPARGYLAVLALLPRRVSDDEVVAITRRIVDRGGPVGVADVGVEISRVTNEMPSLRDIDRVRERLADLSRGPG